MNKKDSLLFIRVVVIAVTCTVLCKRMQTNFALFSTFCYFLAKYNEISGETNFHRIFEMPTVSVKAKIRIFEQNFVVT